MAEIETARKHRIKAEIAKRDSPGQRRAAACFWCSQVFALKNLTLDRLIPKSQGGTNAQSNLVLACRRCNGGRKHDDAKVMLKAVSKLEENLRRPEYLRSHHAHREVDMAEFFRGKLGGVEGQENQDDGEAPA